MTNALPPPVSVNDIYLAAMVKQLDRVAEVLGEVRDRLPERPVATPAEPVQVTEPAPARRPAAKKTTTPQPVKES